MLPRPTALTLAVALLLTGCATSGPEPTPSLAAISPVAWSSYLDEVATPSMARPGPVWTRLNDPVLNALVAKAEAANPEIASAASRVREARARQRADLATLGGQVGLSSSVAAQRQTETGTFPVDRIPGFDTEYVLYDVHFDAAWELDLFGRKQARRDIAAARLASEQERFDDVRTSLLADLARAYVEYRGTQTEMALLETIIERQQSLFDAQTFRREQGEASDLQVERARAQLIEYQTRRPALVASHRAALYRLARLSSMEVAQVETLLTAPQGLPDMDMAVMVDLPSNVLRQRPDIRMAERNYVVAARRSDLARLDLYPNVTLFASAGPSTIELGDLIDPASLALSLGAMVDWTVLDGGRKAALADASDEQRIQAEQAYRSTVLDALTEIETRYAQYRETQHELTLRARSAKTRSTLADMAHARFEGGTGTQVDILETERDAADAKLAVTRLQTNAFVQLIALEKALGLTMTEPAA